jgi:hypothetical protein
MLQGFAVGGLTGGAVSGLVGRVGKEEKKLAETDKAAQTIGDINTLSTDSKVRPRSTEVFRDFIKGAKEEGPVNQVYIDAGALMQSGVADQVAELSPSVAEQLKVAQETGVTTMNIAIPVEEYAAAIAPTEYAQSLFEHLKTDPEGFTVAEKKEAMQGDRLDELGKEFEKAVEQDNKDSEFQQSSERLRKMLLDQHNALGHFQNDTNKQYAALWSHRFDTLAEAQGITPEEAYKNYVSKYSSEFQQGYDQAKPFDLTKLAETEGFKTGQPVSFDFSHNTESATALFGKPKKGDQFQRDLEPSGRYVVQVPDATKVDTTNGRESGQLTFNNPLVLNAETWKKDLAAHYKKTGKRLSQALIADGYDGVVTVDKYGTSEILDLTTFDESKALYQSPFGSSIEHRTPLAEGQATIDVDGVDRPTTNSNGQPIHWSEEGIRNFWKWFGDSKVVDGEGKPMVVYHGTDADFTEFDPDAVRVEGRRTAIDSGISLSYSPKFASGYANKENGKVIPVYVQANHIWKNDEQGIEDAKIAFEDKYNEPMPDAILEKVKEGHWSGVEGILKQLKDYGGYDAVAVNEAGKQNLIVFDPTQIKSATGNNGNFDPNDANILHQSVRDLMVTHNLSEKNLLHVQKMGGIPVPSLAVTKKETPLDGFGEITLMGSPEMADPKGYAKTQVFGADIYSPRYPGVEYQVAPKVMQEARKTLKPAEEATGARFDWDDLERNGPKYLDRSAPLMWMFLREKGIEPITVKDSVEPLPPALAAYADFQGFKHELVKDPEFQKAAEDWNLSRLTPRYDGDASAAQEEIDLQKANAIANDLDAPGFVHSAATRITDYQHLKRRAETSGGVDRYETQRAMASQIEGADLNTEMEEFAQGFVASLNPKEKIFQGFTNSGNRRYVDHTLENVVKILKKELRGGEGFNYGIGSLRAKFTPQFKTIAQIQKNKDRLMSSADFEKVKEEIDTELSELSEVLGLSEDQTIGVMEDLPKMGLQKAVQYYDPNFQPTDEQRQATGEFLTRLQNLPTAYFEAKILRDVDLAEFNGAVVPSSISQKALDALKARGITDIKTYEAGNEQDRSAKIAEFEHLFFQKQNDKARGSFNPDTLTISLLKGADLSTFLHETGHYFLEMQFDLAAKLQGEADIFGYDSLKPGERTIVADTQKILDWFGVPDLQTWYNMSLDEKRPHHEQFARGFEAYLFEGNAPSIELQAVFQKFRDWLVRVYKSLKNLNVELTDEVRGVFDRMLASEEQIALAEQARSMMPLFTTIDQAPMSPDEFRDYQEQGKAATAAAVGDLESRGLRDMQWLRNARSKALKALQKEAKEKRREVQMDVRAEVMAQPIYRAWTLLTSKINPEDKLPANTPPKSNPDFVDPSIDSLFAAIGKLGGVDKEELFSTWGVDPAYKPHSGVFGKPVWRKDGGRTIDGMLEALAEHGYLPKDQHGKADTRDFEEAFDRELRGDKQYSVEHDYTHLIENRAGDQVANPGALAAVRFDLGELLAADYPKEIIELLKARKMVANNGLHPDIVAGLIEDEQGNPSFSSGDALVRGLAEAEPPKEAIENLTDVRMLEKYGDIATPDALEKAADRAIHNDVRARVVATEANALAKATGQRKVLAKAAKALAEMTISRQKVRNVTPGQYTNAEARAAKSAEKYLRAKDLVNAAAEKRNQLFNLYAARAAMDAKDSIEKGLRYLKKFNSDIKGIDADYADQIAAILNRFDLRKITNKEVERRIALSKWLDTQRDAGFEPDIPDNIKDEAFLKSYKELTVEEFRGLVDSVKQIEHLGRLKKELLTAKDRREFEVVRDEITASIEEHAQDRTADTRTPTTNLGRSLKSMKAFAWAHAKVGTLARILDGGKDGGPVWEYLIRPANERGDWETTMRAEATKALSEIMAPVFALGKMGGSGKLFPTVGRSFNRESVLAIALNSGNQGNLQRLLGGEGWTVQQIMPILQSLTADEWRAVQAIWDHFESYRPEIAAKERRVYGKEPNWVEPAPFTIKTADGQKVNLRGGYYPIKYDPAASQRAEEHNDAEAAKRQLQGAYTSATTRRSFTKSRVEKVNGRPLLYTLSGMYSGVNDVIHDLAWHEWLIDANRLLRARSIDASIRNHYGPEVKQQFKDWSAAIAEGEKGLDHAGEIALAWLRQGISASGLGFNLMSAMMQPTGITQSISRVGAKWVGLGVNKYLASPIETAREVNELSEFMQNRARTRFRELNELRNQVQDQSKFKEFLGQYAYFLMMRCQQAVDVPTWWGAYQKAQAEGFDDERAVALADQAVIDSQGSGMTKDLSAIERSPKLKLFTVFYSYMNTALNLGIDKTMSAEIGKRKAKLAAEYVLLYVIPAALGLAIKDALTPNGDDDDDYFEKLPKRLIAAEIDYLMGLMVVVREFSEAAKLVTGSEDHKQDYQGPAGLRFIADAIKLSYQVGQGDFDTAFRKSFVNLMGDGFGLPAAQINRTWAGVEALSEGKTSNPAAIAFGFKEQR